MDFTKYSFLVLITTLILTEDVLSFTLTATKSSDKAILGKHNFDLACSYQLATGELFISLGLQRKRAGESGYSQIISFPGTTLNKNASYNDDGINLENRTTLVSITSESQTATVTFTEIQCDDKADYLWVANYYTDSPRSANQSITFVIQANNNFENDKSLSYNPNINIAENDEVVFTCSGDVGYEPTGQLLWFIYFNNDENSVPEDKSSMAVAESPVYNATSCSNHRQSTLRLTMTKAYHNLLVRCTVSQFNINQFGDDHVQTTNIPVFYSPRMSPIEKNPNQANYLEGLETLTLNCLADAYPAPQYYHWELPDNTTFEGQMLTLSNLTVDHSGTYKCYGVNTFLSTNHTAEETVELIVNEVPPSTTPTTPSTSDSTLKPGTTASPSTDKQDDSKNTTIIIVVVVVVVVIIIIIIAVLVYLKTRRKPKEIEEPPEKPRNNQGLFYGNRPDLVSADHNAKNNMGSHGGLNSSFNNSFDSSSDTKPRNDDGLLYIDLQFDNKPGSRRPIQLVDNMNGGNTPYADIVNPRV